MDFLSFVTRMVLEQGLQPALLGAMVGTVLALAGGRFLEMVLFGVRPNDPLVLSCVVLIVLSVAVVATLVPKPVLERELNDLIAEGSEVTPP